MRLSTLRRAREAFLSADRARELLSYDPHSGFLTWKLSRGRKAKAGFRAGYDHHTGYRMVIVTGVQFMEHRLAWLVHHGEWPIDDIDHVNMRRNDNRIENLRPATRSQNCSNKNARRDNSTGIKGVWLSRGRWQAAITKDGKRRYLGSFTSIEDAQAAYSRVATELYGSYARAA